MERFENSKFLQKIKIAPVQSSVCPIDSKEFAKFFGTFFSSSFVLTPNDEDKRAIQHIPPFRLEELDIALKGMANLRGTDEDGIVAEMIKYSSISFKENLLRLFNQALSEGSFDDSWHIAILQILSKE